MKDSAFYLQIQIYKMTITKDSTQKMSHNTLKQKVDPDKNPKMGKKKKNNRIPKSSLILDNCHLSSVKAPGMSKLCSLTCL